VAVKVEVDKVSRYEDASIYYAGGQVWHPEGQAQDGIDTYERQLLAVPEVTHDDFADSGAQAVLYLLSAKQSHRSGVI
jgi:phage terminase large subunit-like protein